MRLETKTSVNFREGAVHRVLNHLLEDKSANRPILLGTDAYDSVLPEATAQAPLTPELLMQLADLIRPRVCKDSVQQAARTHQKAEVFTPSSLCGQMIDRCTTVWLNCKHTFFQTKLPFTLKRTPQQFIKLRWLELTCGEAPFIVSRYDAATGKLIPTEDRMGILDRKIRVVNELATTEEEWMNLCFTAFQSVYGYEYQGDNLLIARANLYLSFLEYTAQTLHREPSLEEQQRMADIIARNFWQMDGLTDDAPADTTPTLFSMDDFLNENAIPPQRTIPGASKVSLVDWRTKRTIFYSSLSESHSTMKFDFVIGNPPYQLETENVSESNGQLRRRSIFHYFQQEADKIATVGTVLIYPGGRWIQRSGKGMNDFGLTQINDPRLKEICFYPDSGELFQGIDIADGVSIVTKEMSKKTGGFQYIWKKKDRQRSIYLNNPGDNIIPLDPENIILSQKIDSFIAHYNLGRLHDRILPQKLFGIESDFVEKNRSLVREYESDQNIDFSKEVKLYANDRAGKAGRTKWFVTDRTNIPTGNDQINKWKVVVSSANAGGQKRDNQLELLDQHSVFGRSRVALGTFRTKQEAENFYRYVQSLIIRYAFLMTDENLTTLGMKVPDLPDYSDNNGIIDFSKDIDRQFMHLMNLTEEDMDYIRSTVPNRNK